MYARAILDGSRPGDTVSHPALRIAAVLLLGLPVATASRMAKADDFANVHYEADKDQLVVTTLYRGTNPDYTFSLHCGPCKDGRGGGLHEIEGTVLDSQWQDAVQHNYKTIARFSLADVTCRPAKGCNGPLSAVIGR